MILIVDSEKKADLQARAVFAELGFADVEIVKTADRARELVNSDEKKIEISLIIINSVLDDADGFELCREISKTEIGSKAHIIILVSSIENKTAIEKAKHSGANDFAVKPFMSTEFKKHIQRYTMSKVVLLVEDDPVIRQMVIAILSKYTVEIITVDDGVVAHNLINTMLPVRMVLLDIGLPNMSGIQLIASIRNKQSWKKVPIVMLTSSTEATDVKTSLSSGANDYIVKPFKVDDFMNRLSRYLPDAD